MIYDMCPRDIFITEAKNMLDIEFTFYLENILTIH